MKIALAQINPIIGDIKGNLSKIEDCIKKAQGNDLIVFPELAIPGYPPRDLLYRYDFVQECQKALETVATFDKTIGVLIGNIMVEDSQKKLRNSAVLLYDGKIYDYVNKTLLPSYDVFEEDRYFEPAGELHCIEFKGKKLGISICEDIWNEDFQSVDKGYTRRVIHELKSHQPDILINLSASPYYFGKNSIRYDMLNKIAKDTGLPFVYVNQVGGNDELVFDGTSIAFDKNQNLAVKMASFAEDMAFFDTDIDYSQTHIENKNEEIDNLYNALVLGLKDYFYKTGFKKAVLGLSGGIDSSLSVCIAVDALGKENVVGISLPSRYSSDHSLDDARILAQNLDIEYRVIEIEDMFKAFTDNLNPDKKLVGDLAEENIQARIRGAVWMYISNRENCLALSNGNKSEVAVGYSTLYGDMCGALSVIGDVVKTRVYDLCRYINRNKEIIPNNVLTKAPSAELRPNQKDQDTLPDYEILDRVIISFIEEGLPVSKIIEDIGDKELVYKILNMIDRCEYKRRQAAPIIKVSEKSFGMGRRMPIAQGFRWR